MNLNGCYVTTSVFLQNFKCLQRKISDSQFKWFLASNKAISTHSCRDNIHLTVHKPQIWSALILVLIPKVVLLYFKGPATHIFLLVIHLLTFCCLQLSSWILPFRQHSITRSWKAVDLCRFLHHLSIKNVRFSICQVMQSVSYQYRGTEHVLTSGPVLRSSEQFPEVFSNRLNLTVNLQKEC